MVFGTCLTQANNSFCKFCDIHSPGPRCQAPKDRAFYFLKPSFTLCATSYYFREVNVNCLTETNYGIPSAPMINALWQAILKIMIKLQEKKYEEKN